MGRRTKLLILFFAVLILAVLSRPILDLIPYKYATGNTSADHLSPERVKVISPDRIVKLINPQPSATVLDLGAGYGLFTFPLARMVGGSGKVFATDVEPQVISYLNEQARKEGLTNVTPVMVKSFGFDQFYSQHTFDIILASDVLPDIVMLEGFARKLRPSLKRDTGRLWITVTRADPDFTDLEFKEPVNLSETLRIPKVQSSIGPKFRKVTRQVSDAPAPNSPANLVELMVEDANRLLEDPTLWPEAQSKKWPLSPRNRYLLQGLSDLLERRGVFKKTAGTLDEESKLALRILNRFIIMDLLGLKLWGKAVVFTDLTEKDARHQVHKFETPISSEAIISLFRGAGYELVKEHNTTPYCYIFEFKSTTL